MKIMFAKLDGENYFTWKYKMELYLRKEKVWAVVSADRPTVPAAGAGITDAIITAAEQDLAVYIEKDELARVLIGLCVDDNQLPIVRNHDTAKATWSALRSYYERNTFSNRVQIKRQIWGSRLSEDGDMEKHIRDQTNGFQKLVDLGETDATESWKVAIFMYSLPPSYDNLVQALEARPDADLTLSLVHSKCLAEYTKRRNANSDGDQTVLKTTARRMKCYFCKAHTHVKKDCVKFKEWLKKQPNKQHCEKVNKVEHNDFLFHISTSRMPVEDDEWIIDSGATTHITNNKRLFETFDPKQGGQVTVANDHKECAKGKGTCTVSMVNKDGDSSTASLRDVLYAQNIRGNMISVHKLMKNGFAVIFDKGMCEIKQGSKQIAVADEANGLFILRRPNESINVCSDNDHKKGCLHHWHRMFGHRDPEAIKTMHAGNLIDGMKLVDCGQRVQCETCMEAKSTRLPFPKQSKSKTKAVLDLIHTDVCGPMQTESFGKKRYVLTFIDDYSKYSEIYFLHKKSETEDKLKEFVAMVKTKFGRKPGIIRSDRGGEYIGNNVKRYLGEMGIQTQFTAPYSPQQNGVAERKNRSLMEMARCMLTDSGLPKSLWAEAVNTANYIQNRTITKGAQSIPYQLWNDERPSVCNFEIFGTKCYVHIPTEKRKKLDNSASAMYFVGYERGSKAYRLYDGTGRKVIISRDVRFIDNKTHTDDIPVELLAKPVRTSVTMPIPNDKGHGSTNDDGESGADKGTSSNADNSRLEYREASDEGNESSTDDDDSSVQSDSTVVSVDLESSLDAEYGNLSSSFGEMSLAGQMDDDLVSLDDEDDETSDDNSPRVSSRVNKGKPPSFYQANSITTSPLIDEPKSLSDALASDNKPKWIAAMKDEIASMEKNETWELCRLPKDRKAIGCKWVYKTKTDASGKVTRYKARLVAQGFSQKFGTDYDQVFAPVARQTTFRVLLSIASKQNLLVHHLDIKTIYNIFLNGKLPETIYMKQPPGFIADDKDLVCHLKKGIYGLKQAAKIWYDTVHAMLAAHKFERAKADPCFYSGYIDAAWVFVLVYVDDILIVAKSIKAVNDVKAIFARKFDTNDLGEVKQYLGIDVTRDNNGIFHLCQAKYINKLVVDFGMAAAKTSSIPMQVNYGKSTMDPNEGLLLSNAQYQKLIGSLLYVSVNTRPDIAASISILAQRVSKPHEEDWNELKRVLKYLKGTANLKLALAKRDHGGDALYGYSDANWAENKSDRKSNSGHVFLVNGGAVCWSSRKQSLVALSTCEAEFVALSEACRAASWIKRLLIDMKQNISDAVLIHEDNQSCLNLVNGEERLSDRSKHIDTRFHFVKDYIKQSMIKCQYCPTDDMLADILTKALPTGKFLKYRIQLGLHD